MLGRYTGSEARRRGWILAVLVTAQLMLMLDVTIVNIALPSAQGELGLSAGDRQWVVTAYALTFGGLLLLGGRIADDRGRRRMLLVSLAGFAVASALGGLAWAPWPLFVARALQGMFAALMAPAVLSYLSVTFPAGPARARAFGVYSAVSAAGGAVGLIFGGVLTEYLSWRWCLLVNTPIAVVTAVAAAHLLAEHKRSGRSSYDVNGAGLVTLGVFAIVYATSRAAHDTWASAETIGFLAFGAVLLAAFLAVERRVTDPLLPLRFLAHRARMGVFLASLVSFGANMGVLLIVVVYLQETLGLSALESGLAFLPFMGAAAASSFAAARLLRVVSPRALMAGGFTLAFLGVLSLTSLGVSSTYEGGVLPGLLLDGFGVGFIFVPANNIALAGVAERDAGVVSGALNATQQVGAAVGVAVVNAIAVSAAASLVRAGEAAPAAAAVEGFGRGLAAPAGLMALGILISVLFVNAQRAELAAAEAVP